MLQTRKVCRCFFGKDNCINLTGQITSECSEIRKKLQQLTLDNDAVWARERARPEVQTVWPIKAVYLVLCWVLDVLYNGRPIQRWWCLETVARCPYFSYISSAR